MINDVADDDDSATIYASAPNDGPVCRCDPTEFRGPIKAYDKNTKKEIFTNSFNIGDDICPVCPYGHPLIFCQNHNGTKFFKHKNISDMAPGFSPMTDWHDLWEKEFEKMDSHGRRQVEFTFYAPPGEIFKTRNRRPDITIHDHKRTLEIQHSYQSKDTTNDRVADHKIAGFELYWLINGNYCTTTTKLDENRYQIHFYADHWKYRNFADCDRCFLDINDEIFYFEPNRVAHGYINASAPLSRPDFINMFQNAANFDELYEKTPSQCTIIVDDKGAGSGKSYDTTKNFTEPRWFNIESFIYVTKQKSNIEGNVKQLQEHIKNDYLPEFTCISGPNAIADNKFHFEFKSDITGQSVHIFYGTLDAFVWAVSNPKKNSGDIFAARVQAMAECGKLGGLGQTTYGGKDIKVDSKMLICVDEAQDNGTQYFNGILGLAMKTHASVYLCGDTLQSLKEEKNLITEANDEPNSDGVIQVIKGEISNVTRRYGPSIARFVNAMVPYESFGKDPVTSDFSDEQRHNAVFENRARPDSVLKGVSIWDKPESFLIMNGENKKNILEEHEKFYEKFINDVKTMIENFYLVPDDFILIFPILRGNVMAGDLERRLNQMWGDMFLNPDYIERVLKRHPYWKDNYITARETINLCQLHSSAGDGSINLAESRYKTRIVSVHTAKGDGRAVSIAFLSQSSIELFEPLGEGYLVYESFVNVGVTRAKLHQIVVTSSIDGEIYDRIRAWQIQEGGTPVSSNYGKFPDFSIKTEINKIDLTSITQDDMDKFIEIYENVFEPIDNIHERVVKNCKTNDSNQDIEHHQLRGAMAYFGILCAFIETYRDQETIGRTQVLLKAIQASEKDCSKPLLPKDYDNFEHCDKLYPLFLSHDSIERSRVLMKIIKKHRDDIAQKLDAFIKGGEGELDYTCPLQALILQHMLEVDKSTKSDLSPALINRILHSHLSSVNDMNPHVHRNCDCIELARNFTGGRNTPQDNAKLNGFYDSALDSVDTIKKDVKDYYGEHPKSKCKLHKRGELQTNRDEEEITYKVPFTIHTREHIRVILHRPHISP
ncbi:MAG: hypothetical protein CMM25_08660, partial [Rhodospirillaceae bacterium]|nr:hypothetical protein [Rhodospirillaceae bacterium]